MCDLCWISIYVCVCEVHLHCILQIIENVKRKNGREREYRFLCTHEISNPYWNAMQSRKKFPPNSVFAFLVKIRNHLLLNCAHSRMHIHRSTILQCISHTEWWCDRKCYEIISHLSHSEFNWIKWDLNQFECYSCRCKVSLFSDSDNVKWSEVNFTLWETNR